MDSCDTYYQWHTRSVELAGRRVVFATKPGMPFHGSDDPAIGLLAEHIDVQPAWRRMLFFHGGAGAAAARLCMSNPHLAVLLTDRNMLCVQAARRTLQYNDVAGEVVFSHGTAGLPATGKVDAVAARLPKGRAGAVQFLWDAFAALRPGGRFYLAGGNNEGIKPALARTRELFGAVEVLGYGGGHRIGVAVKTSDAPAAGCAPRPAWCDHDWFGRFEATVGGMTLTVCSRPGVFAWDRLDEGSRLLLEHADIAATDHVLDLGCGGGVIGVAAAKRAPGGHVVMVDADAEAVRSAGQTAAANGAVNGTVLAGDALDAVAGERFDLVVSNPPFHAAHAADLAIARQFLRESPRVLHPAGRLVLVANRTLPYEDLLADGFREVASIYRDRRYKVLCARRRRSCRPPSAASAPTAPSWCSIR